MLIIDKILNRTESFTASGYCKNQNQANTILGMVSSLPYVKSYTAAIVMHSYDDGFTLRIAITVWGHGRQHQVAKKIANKMHIDE